MLTIQELKRLVHRGQCDTVLTVFPDMQGRWMGKRVVGKYFLEHAARHGVEACNYLLTVDVEMEPVQGYDFASWASGYGDFHLIPDFKTLRMIPWLEKTALVICDLEDESGRAIEIAPRTILKRQVDKAKKMGFSVMMGSELEFYLFKETYESAQEKRYQNLRTAGSYIEDYHIFQTSKDEPIIREIRNQMCGAGVDVEFSKGEWGAGQHEINLRYSDALGMADRHSVYKNGVKEIAFLKSAAVTFMAKYNTDSAGSSCHIHTSLWDAAAKKNHFWDEKKRGSSKIFENFLAGQMLLARDLSVFFAPYANSYKRYQAGSFAPTKIAWGRDNRTCGFRIVGTGPGHRIENRVPGADANPYLAFAATIAAGLYGIQNKLTPPDIYQGNAYIDESLLQVPLTLTQAIEALQKSELAKTLLGPETVKHYLHAAKIEQSASDKNVTDFELKRGFERL